MKLPIYLDNHATTRVAPEVLQAMLPYFTEEYGNPASTTHEFGRRAEAACELARRQVAGLIGAQANEIVFTSGATESNNIALKGVAAMLRPRGNHMITVCTEHHAVLDPCKRLEREGFQVTFLPVDGSGLLALDQVAEAIRPETILISVMAANNEIGTIQPIGDIGKLARQRGVLFHTDAAQAVGHVPLDVHGMNIDLLSLSGHKIYGPKGIGALYMRRRPPVRLVPLFDGGGHERNIRSGTLPVPLVVGLGKACAVAQELMPQESERLRKLATQLHESLRARLEGVRLNGHPDRRLPGNLNLSFAGVQGEALIMSMKTLAVSSGSACTSANPEPSYVLRAIGVDEELAFASIRFGIGRYNTEDEIGYAADTVVSAVNGLRSLNPLWQESGRVGQST